MNLDIMYKNTLVNLYKSSKKIKSAVIVKDAGFYFEALNEFPGTFIKSVNEWFSVEDFINLMYSKANHSIIIQDCSAYCHPNERA